MYLCLYSEAHSKLWNVLDLTWLAGQSLRQEAVDHAQNTSPEANKFDLVQF